jgi:hypothetical protein
LSFFLMELKNFCEWYFRTLCMSDKNRISFNLVFPIRSHFHYRINPVFVSNIIKKSEHFDMSYSKIFLLIFAWMCTYRCEKTRFESTWENTFWQLSFTLNKNLKNLNNYIHKTFFHYKLHNKILENCAMRYHKLK